MCGYLCARRFLRLQKRTVTNPWGPCCCCCCCCGGDGGGGGGCGASAPNGLAAPAPARVPAHRRALSQAAAKRQTLSHPPACREGEKHTPLVRCLSTCTWRASKQTIYFNQVANRFHLIANRFHFTVCLKYNIKWNQWMHRYCWQRDVAEGWTAEHMRVGMHIPPSQKPRVCWLPNKAPGRVDI